jgi:hypothetical protein
MSHEVEIKRAFRCQVVNVTTDLSTTDEIDVRQMAGGSVLVPAGSSLTSLTIYMSMQIGGTYVPASDVQVSFAVRAGSGHKILDVAFYGAGLKLVGDAVGTVNVTLKA